MRNLGLGRGEPQSRAWGTGSHRPTLPPPPPQVPGSETAERGTWSFLVLLSTPSCLQAQGSCSAHPTLPPPLTPVLARASPPPRSPTSILAAVVPHPGLCTAPWDTQMDPPTHTPLPRASPLHARRGRLDPLSQRRADSPSAPTAAFRRAHGCPTGGPGQRCPVPCPGTQAYLLLRDE